MFQKILIAFDGSEHAKRAARIAGDLARCQSPAELWLVCAMDPVPSELGKPYIDDIITNRSHAGNHLLQQAHEIIGEGVTIHDELLFDSPAESIMTVAVNQGCDLIIMGTRGMSGLRGLLMGSQLQKVIGLSEIPVLAVK